MKTRVRGAGAAFALLSGVIIACGGSGNSTYPDPEPSPFDGDAGSADATSFPGDGSPGGDSGDAWACATKRAPANLAPLDIVLLVDASGSMNEVTSTGPTKWSAVVHAVENFVSDGASANIGVGLQFFPYRSPDVPLACSTNADCKNYGPCGLLACEGPPAHTSVGCLSNADCSGGANCSTFGTCSKDTTFLCAPLGSACGMSAGGTDLGTCQATNHSCAQLDSCFASDYEHLAVDVATLPAAKNALVTALDGMTPPRDGETPTYPALSGAIARAHDILKANPTHRVAVVVGTDGLPTLCQPGTIDDIAPLLSAAAAETSPIKTFVLGVFADGDNASPAGLASLATAGGTGTPFIVRTDTDVTKGVEAALDQFRSTSIPCDVEIPIPASQIPDFSHVNVRVGSGDPDAGDANDVALNYVTTSLGCDATTGGWYYDVDPTKMTPSRIFLCSKSCGDIRAKHESLEVLIGCKTLIK